MMTVHKSPPRTEWILKRTFVGDDDLVTTRYWGGGRTWFDKAKQAARYESELKMLQRYDYCQQAHGKVWQGTLTAECVPSREYCSFSGKRVYRTTQDADAALAEIWAHYSNKSIHRQETRHYLCDRDPAGNHFHLTSKEYR